MPNGYPATHHCSLPSHGEVGRSRGYTGLPQIESKQGDGFLKGPGGNYLIKDLSIFMNGSPDRAALSKF